MSHKVKVHYRTTKEPTYNRKTKDYRHSYVNITRVIKDEIEVPNWLDNGFAFLGKIKIGGETKIIFMDNDSFAVWMEINPNDQTAAEIAFRQYLPREQVQ